MDDIGHGIRCGNTPRIQKQRGSSQGSIQSLGGMSTNSSMVGPAPTTKPPTPPQVTRTGSKGTHISVFTILFTYINCPCFIYT